MIFVSYNHRDAQLVSAFVQKLTAKLDRSTIFFDVWSIQPGDGIIDRMNSGLESASTFAFFVSQNSLTSKMVTLEWQNALYRATNGLCRFIPIKLDQAQMPAIIAQLRYIDLFGKGVDFAVGELVSSVSKTPIELPDTVYENVVCKGHRTAEGIDLAFSAQTYFEPVCEFSLLLQNTKGEFSVRALDLPGWTHRELGYQQLESGTRYFAVCIGWLQGLTPGHPFKVRVTALNGAKIHLDYVMHKTSPVDYKTIPLDLER